MGLRVNRWCERVVVFVLFLVVAVVYHGPAQGAEDSIKPAQVKEKTEDVKKPSANEPLYVIERAVMCEDIRDMEPVREAIVFSVENGHIICFTAVKNIKKRTYLVHKWIHKDEVTTTMRLKVRPPYWRTYSKIQLRETDKGPWRVEILDPKANVLKILRFSVTD
ncbi:MAG TPA: DUF2914 domain-containing protein [Deltaproteobacteria bacterium]|nr:MAG: DUF2914 domain-containing protein [Deltaproteobacteria bacterium]HDM77957.1 DUF2914 domain-containing protein [Deltaproteobacteria bacterium]